MREKGRNIFHFSTVSHQAFEKFTYINSQLFVINKVKLREKSQKVTISLCANFSHINSKPMRLRPLTIIF